MVDTSDEWIRQRTGIRSRHIAGPEELPSDMGLKASLDALQQAGLTAQDLDFIIVATLFPDQPMPNTACVLQKKLRAFQSAAMDVSVACSGFVYALSIAHQFIQTGTYKNILVVGAETLHHITNYKDRSTCILFGDGAGAFVLSQNTDPQQGCVYHQQLKSYGDLGDWLHIRSTGAGQPPIEGESIAKKDYCIQMDGTQVFKKAVQVMCDHFSSTLEETKKTADQIDWVIPHQANQRILQAFCKKVNFPTEKTIFDLETIGNTSAASIPLTMVRAVQQGKIKRGQDVLMIAVGGGMASASMLLKF